MIGFDYIDWNYAHVTILHKKYVRLCLFWEVNANDNFEYQISYAVSRREKQKYFLLNSDVMEFYRHELYLGTKTVSKQGYIIKNKKIVKNK